MRFLHTADWHLGKQLHAVSLLDDQAHILDEFYRIAVDTRPDCIVIAGDIFDRSVPPAEAVALFSSTLERLVADVAVPIILISGNHDSAERLGFASALLVDSGVYIRSQLQHVHEPIVLEGGGRKVAFFSVPYTEPAALRSAFAERDVHSHEQVWNYLNTRLRVQAQKFQYSVCIAHVFIAGGVESESERPLSVGGAEAIPACVFNSFTYAALGHLHRPQSFADGRVRYAGSPLTYSLSEIDQQKSISLVEITENDVIIEELALTPRRLVRRVTGSLAELLVDGAADARADDYVVARVEDRGALIDVVGQLRSVYSNILHIERPFFELQLSDSSAGAALTAQTLRQADTDLFRSFYDFVANEKLSSDEESFVVNTLESLRQAKREL